MDIPSLYKLYLHHPVICTDTRKLTPGCIFFCLKGEHFDGNQFASQALAQGAAYAVISDRQFVTDKTILVADTLKTLQDLAKHHRRQLSIPVIGITGSNGKTTTKELLHTALSISFKTFATIGNLNNHIGVPLSLLNAPHDREILIIEMGANHIGEIRMLCAIAQPTHGLITNIGKAHLEGFGSLEGVQKGKGELFAYIDATDGVAFVNADDPRVTDLAKNLRHKISYSIEGKANADCAFEFHMHDDGHFTLSKPDGSVRISSSLFGTYNAINMVAAFAVGDHFKVPADKMTSAFAAFQSGANRSEVIHHHGCTIVKDAYNANPTSMEAAVRSFASRYPDGIVILGDMKELGAESLEAHRSMTALLASLGLQNVFLVGPEFANAKPSIAVSDKRFAWRNTVDELKANWNWDDHKGQNILIKGSRSMKLEKLLD